VVWEDGGSDPVSYPISTHTIPNAGITPLVAWSIFAFSVDFRAPCAQTPSAAFSLSEMLHLEFERKVEYPSLISGIMTPIV